MSNNGPHMYTITGLGDTWVKYSKERNGVLFFHTNVIVVNVNHNIFLFSKNMTYAAVKIPTLLHYLRAKNVPIVPIEFVYISCNPFLKKKKCNN